MPLGNPIRKQNESRMVSVLATEGQTVFTVQGGYIINHISVFRNGVRLSNSEDFTAGDGSSVTLNDAANVDDRIEFHVFDRFTVQNAIVGAASTQTISGDVVVNGKIFGNLDVPSINTGIVTTGGLLDVNGGISLTGIDENKVIFGSSNGGLQDSGNLTFDGSTLTVTGTLDVNGGATIDNVQIGTANDNEINTSTGQLTLDSALGQVVVDDRLMVLGITTTQALNSTTGTFSSTVSVTNGNLDISDSIRHIGDDNTKIRFPTADTITAETGGSERLRIHSTGEVTIGTATGTGNNLTVQDAGTSTTAGGNICARFQSNGAGRDATIQLSDNVSHSATISMLSSALIFKQAGTERLHINSSGHMGLGITPSDIDSIGRALNIASSTGGAIYLQDTDSPTTKFGAISYNGVSAALQIHAHHASSYIDLGTNGTERLRIGSSGQLGIGGANYGSSGQVLTSGGSGSAPSWTTITGTTINNNANNRVITGSGTANTLEAESGLTYDTQVLRLNNTSANPQFHLTSADNGISELKFGDQSDTTRAVILYRSGSAGDALCFNGYNNTERARIDSSGNFGIGTDSPDRKLDVSGTGNVYGKFQSTNATGAGIELKDTSQNWLIQADGAGSQSSLAFYDLANTSYRVHMKDNGNVEIVNGDLKFASGHGIDFSATGDSGNGSSISETLDDYEQGGITLTLTGSNGGSISYDYRTGHYTKIGNICHVTGDIRTTSNWSGTTGNLYLDLPFTSETTGGCVGAGIVSEWNLNSSAYDNVMIKVDNNESIARFTYHDGSNNNTGSFQTNNFSNGRYLKFAFTYHTQ